MADHRGDLDLMHREDHRTRATAAAELEAGSRDHLQRDAPSAQPRRHEGRKGSLGAQRVEGLDGEAGTPVDVVGVRCSDLVGDPPDGGQEGPIHIDCDAHADAPSCSSASRMEATL